MRLHDGDFVWVDGLPLGIGKVLRQQDATCEVSFFASPARGEAYRETVDRQRVHREILRAQTRVYWREGESEGWRVGRIAEDGRVQARHVGRTEDAYVVELPQRSIARIELSRLFVRWDLPVDDPVAYLAARTTETPFWHEGRRDFLRHALAQRAQCGALTGLWSAAVDLQRHQWRAVRSVLQDPVQRYLLADEVGLGKTIEAGAILRQYVLDEPAHHQALILVPAHLVSQWREELTTRFALGALLDHSIHIHALEAGLQQLSTASAWGMLIVDEAHRPAAWAFSADPVQRARYATLAAGAQRIPRLLLLSATPVLRNEDGFLAMLHLLEPHAYSLADRDRFRHRVAHRQPLAEALSDLTPDAPAFFVHDTLQTLEALTSGDREAARRIAAVRAQLEASASDSGRAEAIAALRAHVSEVYRLHRRLIRHRRASVPELLRGRSGARVLPVSDPQRAHGAAWLEQWREQACLDTTSPPSRSERAALYWLLLEAALAHPRVLRECVRLRRGQPPSAERLLPPSPPLHTLLKLPQVFAEERAWLDRLLAWPEPGLAELPVLLQALQEGQAQGFKTVVFVDSPALADQLAQDLQGRLPKAVLRHRPLLSLRPFLDPQGSAQVLVCDREAEEGLNLQQVRAQVLHFDLPLDPARIEQRLGRLDRFGARAPTPSVIFSYDDPLASAWRHCLQEAIGVFSRSVASLQYVLEAELHALRETLWQEGKDDLERLQRRLQDPQTGLAAEERRIQTQEQLDAMEEEHLAEQAEFEQLEEFDQGHGAFEENFDSWVVERLQFRRLEEEKTAVVRYQYVSDGSHRTLLPPDQFIRWCGPSVDVGAGPSSRATHRLVFSRNQALRRSAQLLRVGHPFLEGLLDHARRDDRGVAHILWRTRPGLTLPSEPCLFWGFDYLLEANLKAAQEVLSATDLVDSALRRRLDVTFPPRFATIWLDQDLEPVHDPALLAVLEAPYREQPTPDSRDIPLSATCWPDTAQAMAPSAWERQCVAAATQAARVLKQRLSLDAHLQRAHQHLESHLRQVQAQLQARISRAPQVSSAERDLLDWEERFARAGHHALDALWITPDSAYAIWLSSHSPLGPSTP
jgi:ATP-dependent helicase HepA